MCTSCWIDTVTAFNYLKKMKTKETEKPKPVISNNKSGYAFKQPNINSKVLIAGLGYEVNSSNLTDELVEKYFKNSPDLFNLIEAI